MGESRVAVFFYGSYINRSVLAEVDLVPDRMEVGRLDGYDIVIRPLANLVPSPGDAVYGVVADATQAELERLYAHARQVLGGVYLPRAVVVEKSSGEHEPALCYIADEMAEAPARADYVARIAGPAREYGFPEQYVTRIEAFAPGGVAE